MADTGPMMLPTGPRPQVAMLLFPGLTALDLIGPQTVLSGPCEVHLLWKTKELIRSDTGIGIEPTGSFADCPDELDVVFVPGGLGQMACMEDPEVLTFLARAGARARYVTAVCTGSLLLGAAGLMDGYKATSHWAGRDLLRLFGAEPVDARVVTDRNRVTGGGVTAGIDFGLTLLATLMGERVAKTVQLGIEYNPAPPFNAGSPASAGSDLVNDVLRTMAPMIDEMTRVAKASAAQRSRWAAAAHASV